MDGQQVFSMAIQVLMAVISALAGFTGAFFVYRKDMAKINAELEQARLKVGQDEQKTELNFDQQLRQDLFGQQERLQRFTNDQLQSLRDQLQAANQEITGLKQANTRQELERGALTDILEQLIILSKRMVQELKHVYAIIKRVQPGYEPVVDFAEAEIELQALIDRYRKKRLNGNSS